MNLNYFFKSLQTQKCFLYFLIIQLSTLLFLVFYEATTSGNHSNHSLMFFIEILIAYSFAVEVLTRIVFEPREFFKNSLNILDSLIFCMLVVAYSFSFVSPVHLCYHDCNTAFSITLLTSRYIIQLARTIIAIKRGKAMKSDSMMEVFIPEEDYHCQNVDEEELIKEGLI